jgi:Ala-tRNA(Pro) deacylase
MVPTTIQRYLNEHGVPHVIRSHPPAVGANQVAQAQHVSGYRLAKPVVVKIDGRPALVVIRGPDRLDLERVRRALGAGEVTLCPEGEFDRLFPGCELGAEPPLGGLYGLPVYVDSRLEDTDVIVLRAGTHIDTIELHYADYAALERPRVADVVRERSGSRGGPHA